MSIVIPDSLTEIVKTKLREMIICGEFAFGQQLAESKLSAHFGVSKTPIREALVQLKEEGLVEVHARRGTFVYRPDMADMQLISETRRVLEVGALHLACEKNHVALVRALGSIVKQMDREYDSESYLTYLELDSEFPQKNHPVRGQQILLRGIQCHRRENPCPKIPDSLRQRLPDPLDKGACSHLRGHP